MTEAELLADDLEKYLPTSDIAQESAAELRRLHAINAELVDALEKISKIPNQKYGTDFEEIEEARVIALMSLAKAKQ